MKVKILDTTLRDGEQTAGVVFTPEEKVQIASKLDALGVNQIEAGIPAMGGDESEAIQGIIAQGFRAKISTWNRAVISDITKSIQCGVKDIHISVPVSDIHIQYKLNKSRKWVIDNLIKSIEYAREHGCWVSIGAEDASRAEMNFLIELAQTAQKHGANQFRYADTVGKLDPFQTYENIRFLKENLDIDIEIHTHNDFGMATANALAAIKGGASFVNTTVNGLGERAGNAPLEEVVMAIKYLYAEKTGVDTGKLHELGQYVAHVANRFIPPSKAILGREIFTVEGDLFVPERYSGKVWDETFSPEEVGLSRKIVIGKHTHWQIIKRRMAEMGINLNVKQSRLFQKKIQAVTTQVKRCLDDQELQDFCKLLY